jgi:hypothetical protein
VRLDPLVLLPHIGIFHLPDDVMIDAYVALVK